MVWLTFGSKNTKDIRDTLETVFTSASLELTFRQTSTMETDGSMEFLDVHHRLTPYEKYRFITTDFVKATAEHGCFISGLSHHPCSAFKSTVLGEAIRMRRLSERDEGYQSALVRFQNKDLRSDLSQNMVQDMITLAPKWKIRLNPPSAKSNANKMVWATSFSSLLKLTQEEKKNWKQMQRWHTNDQQQLVRTLQIIKHQRTEMLWLQRQVHLLHVVIAHWVEILVATEHRW